MKKAFTLAEVLITLGIIGVVAALSTPALVNNTQQAKIGPTLSKFVSTFENAMESLMVDEGITHISDLYGRTGIGETGSEGLANMLAKYMVLNKTNSTGTYMLKDGSTVDFNKFFNHNSDDELLANLRFDINGNSAPNKPGIDQFRFVLGNKGRLYAYGSQAHKNFDATVRDLTCKINGETNEGLACTGAIADNNWKADY